VQTAALRIIGRRGGGVERERRLPTLRGDDADHTVALTDVPDRLDVRHGVRELLLGGVNRRGKRDILRFKHTLRSLVRNVDRRFLTGILGWGSDPE
jgi:hypothetical protein